jgi:hypothetical protein
VELNEILAWVSADRWVDTELLEAVLLVRLDKVSLSVENQINEKYAAILKVDEDGNASFRDTGIQDYLFNNARTASHSNNVVTDKPHDVFHPSEVSS